MKGEKGTCTAGKYPTEVRRTSFNNRENAEAYMKSLKGIGVINQNYIVYQCSVCKNWHAGKPEWAELYGIK